MDMIYLKQGGDYIRKILFIIILFLLPLNVKAFEETVDLKMNGEYVYSERKGIIFENRVYVPVRYAVLPFGIEYINWNEKEKSVTLKSSDSELVFIIGNKTAYINNTPTTTEFLPFIYEDRAYLPVRFISEVFGADIKWEEDMYAVNIKSDSLLPPEHKNHKYTDEDIYWLSRIIEAESKGEPYEGKIAVGNVVINRKNHPDFPDSIYEVIFEITEGKYQFTPVKNNTVYNTPSAESITAAKLALNNTDIVGESLYFLNPDTTSSSWVIKNREYYLTIENHDFYL